MFFTLNRPSNSTVYYTLAIRRMVILASNHSAIMTRLTSTRHSFLPLVPPLMFPQNPHL